MFYYNYLCQPYNYSNIKSPITMYLFIFEFVFIGFLLYSLAKSALRKFCKPDFSKKVVWITGASSGIGQYLAYEFSKYGAELIISARNTAQLQRVKQGCVNKNIITVVGLDMSNYEQVEKTTKQILQQLQNAGKKLDIVVENAGISMRCQLKDYSFSNHVSIFNVNVNGPYKHIQSIVEHMIKNKSGQIVGITSVQGKLATSYRSSYAASKHAFIGILDSLRAELSQYGIKVTNIMPGYVHTNISKNAFGAESGEKFGLTDDNIKKGMSPEAFCKQAVKAIYRGENQAQISNQPEVPIGIFIRNLCPDLAFFLLRLNAKNQTKAVKKAT